MSAGSANSTNKAIQDPASKGRQHGYDVAFRGVELKSLQIPIARDANEKQRILSLYFQGFDAGHPDAKTYGWFERGWADGITGKPSRPSFWANLIARSSKQVLEIWAYSCSYQVATAARAGSTASRANGSDVQQSSQRTFGHSGRGPQ